MCERQQEHGNGKGGESKERAEKQVRDMGPKEKIRVRRTERSSVFSLILVQRESFIAHQFILVIIYSIFSIGSIY